MAIKWCVIVNPNAGSVDDVAALEQSLRRLDSFDLKQTRAPHDAGALAKQAVVEGISHIAAAGGDGTLNEIINGVAEYLDRITLAVIPLGTGNDLARSLGMPENLDQAIDLISAGHARLIDVLRLRNRDLSRLFLNSSAGGFVTKANEKLTTESKDWLGSVAFFVAAARTLPEMEQYHLRVKFDQDESQAFEAYNLIIANGRTMGGGIPVAPAARLDDGLMDVVIVPAMPLPKLAVVFSRVLMGADPGKDLVVHQARQTLVSSRPNFALNVDGEVIGEAPALFDVLEKSLRVVVNPEEEKMFT